MSSSWQWMLLMHVTVRWLGWPSGTPISRSYVAWLSTEHRFRRNILLLDQSCCHHTWVNGFEPPPHFSKLRASYYNVQRRGKVGAIARSDARPHDSFTDIIKVDRSEEECSRDIDRSFKVNRDIVPTPSLRQRPFGHFEFSPSKWDIHVRM